VEKDEPGCLSDAVGPAFAKLTKKVDAKLQGRFGTPRHVFRTVADPVPDLVAIRVIMGHFDDSIDAHYRERVAESRLVAVAGHVRAWLFGGAGAGAAE
jgi:hypothetical protein